MNISGSGPPKAIEFREIKIERLKRLKFGEETLKTISQLASHINDLSRAKELTLSRHRGHSATEQYCARWGKLWPHTLSKESKETREDSDSFEDLSLTEWEELYEDLSLLVAGIDDTVLSKKECRRAVDNLNTAIKSQNREEIQKGLEKLGDEFFKLVDWAEKKGREEGGAVNVLAHMMRGIKLESLFSGAAKTHSLLDWLHKAITDQRHHFHALHLLSFEERRAIYRDLTYLKEQTQEFIEAQKIFSKGIKGILNRSKTKKIKNKLLELQKTIDEYDRAFNFSPEDVKEFRALSIDSHRPIRQHLMNFGKDYIDGAKNLADEMEKTLLKEIEEQFTAIIHSLPEEERSKFSFTESLASPEVLKNIKKYLKPRSSTAIVFDRFMERLEKIQRFKSRLPHLEDKVRNDRRLGNNSPTEPLSSNPAIWRKQQIASKAALKEIFNNLKYNYLEMTGVTEKEAAKQLNKARDEILVDHTRWEKPIERDLQLPRGELASHVGKDYLELKHVMTAANSGYSSACFRGREAGIDCIQSNFHITSIQDEAKEIDVSYLSSATTVEFFQLDEKKRKEATKQQSLEILLQGAFLKKEQSGIDAPSGGGIIDDPLQISFTSVALLSPDKVRDFLLKHPKVRKFISHFSKKILEIDASQVERRILLESIEAMQALEKFDIGEKMEFKDKEGKLIEVKIVNGAKGKCYEVKVEGKDPLYLQFDIAFFNFGTNRIKKYMVSLIGGNQLENDLNQKAWEKMKRQVDGKLEQIGKEKGKLQNVENEKTLLEKELGEISDKHARFIQLEEAFRKDKKLQTKRDMALRDWSFAKTAFAKKLDYYKATGFEDLKKLALLTQREFDIQCLREEIEDQFLLKDYLTAKFMQQNAYSIPSAVLTLGCLLKNPIWTGCRSGKDRTTLQRIETAVRVGMRKVRGLFSHFTEMEQDPDTFRVREHILLNSGHIDEMAYRNIGSPGLNLSGSYGKYLKRFFESGKPIETSYEDIVLGGAYRGFIRRLH